MGEHDCARGIGEIRWVEVGNILDSDCIPCPECTSADYLGPAEAVRAAARPWPSLMPLGDSNDTAPELETPGNASLAYLLTQPEIRAALSRLPGLHDHDHDRPAPSDDSTREAFDAMDGAS